jgi:AraC-like DNA-binding protein
VGNRQLVVEPSSFLVIGAGEKYSMNIAAERPVETCCVFFAQGFVEQIASDITRPIEDALAGAPAAISELSYLSALHNEQDCATIQRVQALARRCESALAPSGFEEEFLLLAAGLLQLYGRIRDEMARLPATRSSTRQELFRRLLRGREYLHSHTCQPVSLAAVARAAGLSLFHFHRSFTQAFQETPHTYLTRLRLARARRLVQTGASVLSASVAVGFSNPSAFTRLFRLHYGELPSAVKGKLARSG